MPSKQPIAVAITGASGAAYALRLLEVLVRCDREVMLTISPSGQQVIEHELKMNLNLERFEPAQVVPAELASRVRYFHHQDYMAPIASGSHRTAGMVICPCSGSTLSAIAHSSSNNLIQRAAEVHLKERRKLVLVPRETPLSLPQIENMRSACLAGAVILPAMPGWYHTVNSLSDLVDFVVARILDQLDVEHKLIKRWGDDRHGGSENDG